MLQTLVIPLAKMGVEKLLDGSSGKVVNIVLFEFLLGKDKDTRLDTVLQKLDTVLIGQKQIVDLISALPAKIALKSSLDTMYTVINGLLLAVKAGSTDPQDIRKMKGFLALTGNRSGRGLADDLSQKLFGTGNLTPAGFWVAGEATQASGRLQADSHVAVAIYDALRSAPNGSVTLDQFIAKMQIIFEETLGWYAYLAAALLVTREYLGKIGQLGAGKESLSNPALAKEPGLAAMAAEFVIEHLIRSSPEAYRLYYHLFVRNEPMQAAIIANDRARILESDDSAGRGAVKLRRGKFVGFSDINYEIDKTVYAEYNKSMLNEANPRLWWNFKRPSGNATPSVCVLQSSGTSKLLGLYEVRTHRINSGKLGVGYKTNDEITLGSSDTDTRAWWTVYVRRDKQDGNTTFNLVNSYSKGALCVNGEPQNKARQVFSWGDPDANQHKIYEIVLPKALAVA